MRWFSLTTNGVHPLPSGSVGEVSVAMKGTGTVVLGYLDNEDNFVAYQDSEATLTDGSTTICACGAATKLRASVTGAAANTAVGVAQLQ